MSAFDCHDIVQRLSAYHDNELSPRDAGLVRAHLSGCEQCAARAHSLRALGDALRTAAAAEVHHLEPHLSSLSARVIGRVSAERREALGARLGRLFEDWHLLWAGLSATASLAVTIVVAALAATALTPGSNDFPAVPTPEVSLPRVPSVSVMPAMLVSMPDDGTDLELALSGIVTREGRLTDPELVGATMEHATLVRALMEQATRTRFAPASRNGQPVAVSVIWLLSRTTVRPGST